MTLCAHGVVIGETICLKCPTPEAAARLVKAIALPAETESALRAAVRRYLKAGEYWCGVGRAYCRDTCPKHSAQREIEHILDLKTDGRVIAKEGERE